MAIPYPVAPPTVELRCGFGDDSRPGINYNSGVSRPLRAKWNQLQAELEKHSRVLIAFSGGCDSVLLAAAARRILGKENVLAVTAVSASLAARERAAVAPLVQQLDLTHQFLDTQELNNPAYTANPSNRCFFCKSELFAQLAPLAQRQRMALADGFNTSDRADFRPGVQAAEQWNVQHPLDAADLTKKEIRVLSRWLKLPTWNKPASPCLSSRIPYGTAVTREALAQIDRAEEALHDLGFSIVRVRHYGDTARIEVSPRELARLRDSTVWKKVSKKIRAAGYTHVEMDPRGFLSGRLNQVVRARVRETNVIPS